MNEEYNCSLYSHPTHIYHHGPNAHPHTNISPNSLHPVLNQISFPSPTRLPFYYFEFPIVYI